MISESRFVVPLAVIGITLAACVGGQVKDGQARDREPLSVFEAHPPQWRVTLAEAEGGAIFDVKLPDHRFASLTNLQEVYLATGGAAVMLIFPLPRTPEQPLRQEVMDLEIYQEPWDGGDPVKEWQGLLTLDDTAGDLYFASGFPVLVNPAHSDDSRQDGAYLEIVLDDVDIQISGGESIEDLAQIASTLDGMPADAANALWYWEDCVVGSWNTTASGQQLPTPPPSLECPIQD